MEWIPYNFYAFIHENPQTDVITAFDNSLFCQIEQMDRYTSVYIQLYIYIICMHLLSGRSCVCIYI